MTHETKVYHEDIGKYVTHGDSGSVAVTKNGEYLVASGGQSRAGSPTIRITTTQDINRATLFRENFLNLVKKEKTIPKVLLVPAVEVVTRTVTLKIGE